MITIGCDPEVAVIQDSRIWHCIGALGGSKKAPKKVKNGAVQEDNVAFEFNIDPQTTAEGFSQVIEEVMSQGIEILGDSYSVAPVASHVYSEEDLSKFPQEAFVFGCDPDYNALTGNRNSTPISKEKGLRSFGGHVHLGWSHLESVSAHDQQGAMIACDYLLGLPSLMLDTDTRRRELYGKAGAYRPKPFGAEYRTLSNFWIFSEANRKWVFEQAQRAYAAAKGDLMEWVMVHDPMTVQRIINSNDAKAAEVIIKDLELA